MIEFPPSYPEIKLLRKAVRWAEKNKDHIPSLSALAPKEDVHALTELGKSWQKLGLGRLLEVSEDGHRSVLFSLDEQAISVVEELRQQSVFGWLRSVARSDWISFWAFIISLIALFK